MLSISQYITYRIVFGAGFDSSVGEGGQREKPAKFKNNIKINIKFKPARTGRQKA
jgi:hypothetical protein